MQQRRNGRNELFLFYFQITTVLIFLIEILEQTISVLLKRTVVCRSPTGSDAGVAGEVVLWLREARWPDIPGATCRSMK